MSGQTMTFEEKQRLIDSFIQSVDPYKKPEPLRFDLRKYADYVKKNNLKGENITEAIMAQFML